mmetsp:Transcript_36993/g.81254  ORF Transcript_36993/g.81254 Transcript_36993/m.81254 type:complete len:495 (+) Transcript_36993:23-1507(+)
MPLCGGCGGSGARQKRQAELEAESEAAAKDNSEVQAATERHCAFEFEIEARTEKAASLERSRYGTTEASEHLLAELEEEEARLINLSSGPLGEAEAAAAAEEAQHVTRAGNLEEDLAALHEESQELAQLLEEWKPQRAPQHDAVPEAHPAPEAPKAPEAPEAHAGSDSVDDSASAAEAECRRLELDWSVAVKRTSALEAEQEGLIKAAVKSSAAIHAEEDHIRRLRCELAALEAEEDQQPGPSDAGASVQEVWQLQAMIQKNVERVAALEEALREANAPATPVAEADRDSQDDGFTRRSVQGLGLAGDASTTATCGTGQTSGTGDCVAGTVRRVASPSKDSPSMTQLIGENRQLRSEVEALRESAEPLKSAAAAEVPRPAPLDGTLSASRAKLRGAMQGQLQSSRELLCTIRADIEEARKRLELERHARQACEARLLAAETNATTAAGAPRGLLGPPPPDSSSSPELIRPLAAGSSRGRRSQKGGPSSDEDDNS